MVLSEDRLQIKWKEAGGPVQGYKLHVRPISGERPSVFHGMRNILTQLCVKVCNCKNG